jgi:uncharacterized repeat protein (TIGR01451 family)
MKLSRRLYRKGSFMKIRKGLSLLASAVLVLGMMTIQSPANAQLNGVTIDFAGATPTTYDRTTGGGAWNGGTLNTDIERSLQGSDFACEDRVSYLARVDVGTTTELQNLGSMTYEMIYSFTLDSSGQSGVALNEPVDVALTTGDSANNNDGGSAVSIVEITKVGTVFTNNSKMFVKVRLTDVEAGETIALRITTTIDCLAGANPTGNLQAEFAEAEMVLSNGGTVLSPAEKISSGAKTIPFQSVGDISSPELSLAKTVTTTGASCPGVESITIEPNQTVRYCYILTNTSNSGGRVGAPAYNISNIADDSGQYPDFTVEWMSGLTDIDGDGQVDDLAAGASASAYYEATFDGDQDTTLINLATVFGFTATTGGFQIFASDNATVFIDAPELIPSIGIEKLTNGFDSSVVLAGSTVNWTYLVSNTGNVELSSVAVVDDQGVTVTCPKSTLAVAEQMTCTGSGTAVIGAYSNVGTVTASYETQTVSDSDVSGYFGANPQISLLKTPDTQTVIEGETATFTITVTNTGNVALNNLTVSDPLVPACAKSQSALTVGEVLSYSCSLSTVVASFTNTATATAEWESSTVTSTDTALVTVDFLPKIAVTKSASDTSIPESGANVTFTVVVANEGVDPFNLTSLVDDRFGNLNGEGSCVTPQTIPVSGSYTCSLTKLLKSEVLTPHINMITASGSDPEGNTTNDSDDATVNFTDVLPEVGLTKVANPTAAKYTGDLVDYTLTITNVGLESFVITSFVDDKFSLSADCSALIGTTLAPGGSASCTLLDQQVSGEPGGSFINTATVVGTDNESNLDTATATATVNFWWYGRTPGYWKNHPNAWPTPYAPTNQIQSIFAIPGALLNSGNLDLDRNRSRDTLMNGLNYRGGSALGGGAQILMRAAIASLLNEAYYGVDFPFASSPADLIAKVNTVLATQSRSEYVSFASLLDYWNNAVHASLP